MAQKPFGLTQPFCLILIAILAGASSQRFFRHEFLDNHKWREPDILNRAVLHRVNTKYIEQPLNHYDASINSTFSMRYMENNVYFEKDGPIIIFLGGEWMISPNVLQAGFVHDLAKEQGGIMFYTEHRYYGLTRPTPDLSSSNLRHLSVDQALADVAFFIQSIKEKPQYQNSPVIVIGGSYSANMAVWMRSKYPHLVQGALASSAPVYAKADFHEYLDITTNVLRLNGEECVESVRAAFVELKNLSQTEEGTNKIQKLFHLCERLEVGKSKDYLLFVEGAVSIFQGAAQYDGPYHGSTVSALVCNVMTNKDLGTPAERLSRFYDIKGAKNCNDVNYKSFVRSMRQIKNGSPTNVYRQWIYQTCTEYGYYQTFSSKTSIYGDDVDLKYFEEFCEDVYGPNYNKYLLESRVKRTNIIYGGLEPDVTNVIFTNGSKDPWHALSVLKSLNDKSPSYFINGTSHCYDLRTDHYTDSEELRNIRKEVKKQIERIIRESKKKYDNNVESEYDWPEWDNYLMLQQMDL